MGAWVDGWVRSTAFGEDGNGTVWGTKVDATDNKSGPKTGVGDQEKQKKKNKDEVNEGRRRREGDKRRTW